MLNYSVAELRDNKNTAYFHPLFIYNQSVIVRVADVTTESKKKSVQ